MTLAPRPAVILLSGGLDSATALAIARAEAFVPYALSFAYGQRHATEVDAARAVAAQLGAAQHIVATIDLRAFGGSALTAEMPVPKQAGGRPVDPDGVPVTYVPARNTIFLSFALGWAEVLGADDIFIGVNALDYSGYPDCRPAFIEAFERLANLATRAGTEGGRRMQVHAPLIRMTKAEIITRGLALGVDFSLTRSCYDPDPAGQACGTCDSCRLRLKGFREAGLSDPVAYQAQERP